MFKRRLSEMNDSEKLNRSKNQHYAAEARARKMRGVTYECKECWLRPGEVSESYVNQLISEGYTIHWK